MNGPEHYAAAERRIAQAEEIYWDVEPTVAGLHLAAAQVHATLALAAATATANQANANGILRAADRAAKQGVRDGAR